jgi:molybdopterin converting factor small subunit
MSVRVVFCGPAAGWAGASEAEISWEGGTVQQLLERPEPPLSRVRSRLQGMRFAVNQEFVSLDAQVRDGDEVAILPPVSGG